MIIHIDTLSITRFYYTTESDYENFPLCVAQQFLKLTSKPYIFLIFLIKKMAKLIDI